MEETTGGKRRGISQAVRSSLWTSWFGDRFYGSCRCCRREQISITNFHAGHIRPHVHGGSIEQENLVPICQTCNLSMGSKNLHEFMTQQGYKALPTQAASQREHYPSMSTRCGPLTQWPMDPVARPGTPEPRPRDPMFCPTPALVPVLPTAVPDVACIPPITVVPPVTPPAAEPEPEIVEVVSLHKDKPEARDAQVAISADPSDGSMTVYLGDPKDPKTKQVSCTCGRGGCSVL